nr:DUF3798 domain-containing protein [Capillibacterium thermochitinicola]
MAVVLVGALAFYFTRSSAPEVATDTTSFKIGLITGTVSQNEDEYRGAEAAIAKYPGLIKHVTYPDNFMQEQETFIAQVTGMAADPEIKAIVINQAVPGTVAAIRRVRETRPDMIFIAGEPHEDPPLVEPVVDVTLIPNQPARGKTIPQLAKEMGAKALLHYSFPRHMSYAQLAERRDLMKEECEKLGIEFVFVNAPDPMGEGGIPAAQQFILEDVPRQVAQYGKDIALFSTNCAMQEPLIAAALQTGAIFPEQCCPSPTHGYPGALALEITDEIKGNFPAILKAIDKKIVEMGRGGRFATWPIATGYLHSIGGVEIAKLALEGKLDLNDIDAVSKVLSEVADTEIVMTRLSDNGNFYMYVGDSYIFGK